MKKFMFAVITASTILSTPAMAADWAGKTYGQDAWGIYGVNAKVASFCKFGTENSGGAGTNGTAEVTSAQEADGKFTLDIQNPSDDTVRAANATYNIAYAVCNSPFNMQLRSQNTGLKSSRTTGDQAFIQTVPYNIHFAFDGSAANDVSSNLIGGAYHNINYVNEARAGAASVNVSVAAMDKLLLEGTYSDTLEARLSPVL